MSETSVIELRNVSLSFENRRVLNNIDFKLHNGEFTYLIGATGIGKSSFLKLLYRDIVPDTGTVRVTDYPVNKISMKEVPMLRRRLGIVFQDFQLLQDRNVFDNVAFALQVTGEKPKFVKQRVLEVLTMVGLSHRRKHMPKDLSGGEQQRVVIARALANEPRILLADEPTGNLDPGASKSIMDLLKQINNRGMAVLMVTHDYALVKKYPFRTVRMIEGSLQELQWKGDKLVPVK
ncbi:cell division ATP-binding protein FtsE [Balneola sp. EhC07]|jgi:cell division transport system ATP-binding protein|uniref:cell division ATP-binding protein FtsE n=1 Tax=Balneola sp. EhC07 TaxID=1849360 RepID=UPI0007F3A954|nr:cell division ATP-binding protein FtsE [Balneola sp. EhC07]MBO6572044.1 cell division ATP-binding protein FtsE [Balneola sp.]MBR9918558.1 cell division ATP-binding protein FtsE [bacterium]OAN60723.1 cell division ATP-binding protein FtsE [Balneola sp. EhC07]|tara:strand:- start:75763 stop:76464 length:702 start_codon:yes stop_codon:yes gene_type:complete